MLSLTQDAVEAIKRVAPPGAGLRVYTAELPDNGTQPVLQVAIVEEPGPDDRQLDAEGAQVFLDPMAEALLDSMVLDAKLEGESLRFAVAQRG